MLSLVVITLTKFTTKYAVKNTLELISKLSNVAVFKNCRLVAFGVSNLFGSVPIKELKTILSGFLNKYPIRPKSQRELLNLLEICTFNNKFFQQKDGVPMGSPISPLLAEIFTSTFENKLFSSKNPPVNSIHFWARYVDDIICIWKGGDRQLTLLLDFLNFFYPTIKFTQEI